MSRNSLSTNSLDTKSTDAKRGLKQLTKDRIVFFATLLLLWLMLNGTLAIEVLLTGILVSLTITLLFRKGLSFFTEFNATPQAFITGIFYYAYFFKELFKSNIKLAAIVLSPSLPINPGIVKVQTKLKTKMGRLMLANSISLTPGTLSVELCDEWIYVHWVNVEATDIDEVTKRIASGFESYLEVMYG